MRFAINRSTIALSMLCAFLLVAGCSDSPEKQQAEPQGKTSAEAVRQETKELVQAIKQYSADQRDMAAGKARQVLEDMDRRIAELEAGIDENWDQMNQDARDNARAALEELRRQRAEMAEWYGKLEAGTAESWEHAKKGFANAYEDLANAWTRSVEEFGADK